MFSAAFDAQYPNTFTCAYFHAGSPCLVIDPRSLETFTIRPASDFLNNGRKRCRGLAATCRTACSKQDHVTRLRDRACDFETDAFVGARHKGHWFSRRTHLRFSRRSELTKNTLLIGP